MIYQINSLANTCGSSKGLGGAIYMCVRSGGTVIYGACEEISLATIMIDIAESNSIEFIEAVHGFTKGEGSALLAMLLKNAEEQSAKAAKEHVWIAN